VYAQMAKESYNKAFLFGDANSSVGEKIYQIRSLRGKDIGEE
jgi:hypothetical protein